tara:strand:+ start:1970 stop:2275 length:306 start_codon:yes stop_codon:yes gene_type:complete
MKYEQIPPTYRDDLIAEALYAREIEYFHYDFDRINFEHILKDLPECDYRASIEKRLFDTVGAMAQVELTVAALRSQITNSEAHAAAVLRITEKRKNHVPAK